MTTFDPNLPANNSPIRSAELRDQFNSLKDQLDQCPTLTDVEDVINTQTAGSVVGVDALTLSISNPPTQAQVEALRDKINELLAALMRA